MIKKTAAVAVVVIAVVGVMIGTAFSQGGGRDGGRGRGRGRAAQNDRGGAGAAGPRAGRTPPGRGRDRGWGGGRAGPGRGQAGRQQGSGQGAVVRTMQQVRRRLRPSQQEWQKMASPLQDVVVLDTYLDEGRGAGMGASAGGGGAVPPALQERERLREMVQTRAELQRALMSQQGNSDQIGSLLRRYRRSREQARNELQSARQRLRREVNMRQEAHLVLMGLLD